MSANAGFQLFPNPNTSVSPKRNRRSSTNSSRKTSTKRHAISPQSPPQSAVERAQSPVFPGGQESPQNYDMSGRFSPPSAGYGQERYQQPQHQYSQFVPTENQRSPTPTGNLTRNVSNASQPYTQIQGRSQTPLAQIRTASSPTPTPPRQISNEAPAIRSIFPTYNPDIRLEHQDYYPTVHIGDERIREVPRAVLSKRPYSPSISDQEVPSLPAMRNQLQRNPSIAGTARGGNTTQNQGSSRIAYGNGQSNPNSPPFNQRPTSFQRKGTGNHSPTMEQASTTEELKELWKVTNGWRASPSEGRTFVLQMTSDPEEPIHTLSSTTDPFYTLRIEPTSTSAHLTMLRHDPSKAPTTSSPTSKLKTGLGLNSKSTTPQSPIPPKWSAQNKKKDETTEVLSTTLEESHRRLPPNDGLIALLYPTSASSLVITHHLQHPTIPDTYIRQTAERECARLIYDSDSGHYYLCHPCLSQPFIIRIYKSLAWSKIEYVLEHESLPRDLARLSKGAGGSWCVIDSGTAGGLEGVYVVDVAVTALCVVAFTEEKLGNGITKANETFEGPPTPKFISEDTTTSEKSNSRFSIFGAGKKGKGIQEFEIDLESQDSFKPVEQSKEKGDKGPFLVRVCLFGVRCAVWVVGALFGCLLTVLIGLGGCLAKRIK